MTPPTGSWRGHAVPNSIATMFDYLMDGTTRLVIETVSRERHLDILFKTSPRAGVMAPDIVMKGPRVHRSGQ